MRLTWQPPINDTRESVGSFWPPGFLLVPRLAEFNVERPENARRRRVKGDGVQS
jgi:hypothetical protein